MKYINHLIYFYIISISCVNAHKLTQLTIKKLSYNTTGFTRLFLINIRTTHNLKASIEQQAAQRAQKLPPLPAPATPPSKDNLEAAKVQETLKAMQVANANNRVMINSLSKPYDSYDSKDSIKILKDHIIEVVKVAENKSSQVICTGGIMLNWAIKSLIKYSPQAFNTTKIVLKHTLGGIITYSPPVITGIYKTVNNIKYAIEVTIEQGTMVATITYNTLDSIKTGINFTKQQVLNIRNTTYNVAGIIINITNNITEQSSGFFSMMRCSSQNLAHSGILIESESSVHIKKTTSTKEILIIE